MEPADIRIFVVDDDSSLREAVARLIRSAGWGVETFASAREFLARPADAGSGCLLLDVRMPEMTGPELHGWMTTHGVSLPIIFLTGHGDVAGGVQAMKMGAVDYLLKPVDPETLLNTIRQAIDRHAVEQHHRQQQQDIASRLARLSRREREVMDRVILGELNKQIADRLAISLKTVKAHRARVMAKMEVHSVAVLVSLCEKAGIRPEPGA